MKYSFYLCTTWPIKSKAMQPKAKPTPKPASDEAVKTALEYGDLRVYLWPFGGIVGTSAEVGWTWYQKKVVYSNTIITITLVLIAI